MQLNLALELYGGNQSALARALGVKRAAVSKWKKVNRVPPLHAARLERLTHGALKFDPADYPLPCQGGRKAFALSLPSYGEGLPHG